MPDITFTLTTEVAQDMIDLYCERFDYEHNKEENETRAGFSLRKFKAERKREFEEFRHDKWATTYGVENKAWQDQYEADNAVPDDVVVE